MHDAERACRRCHLGSYFRRVWMVAGSSSVGNIEGGTSASWILTAGCVNLLICPSISDVVHSPELARDNSAQG